MQALKTLVVRGPTPLTELAEAEQVRPPTMTRLVERLEHDGYVLRHGLDSLELAELRTLAEAIGLIERIVDPERSG